MAFFLISVENNVLFDQIFQTQTLENEENVFWKFFYAETNSVFIIISMMYDPAYEREMINGKKSKQQW